MKITLLTLAFYLTTLIAFSQDAEVKLDLLQAPNSPAFNLLGISPSSIDKPTNLTSFAFSLQNATSNFSQLPSDFAMEFAPFLIFKEKSKTVEDLQSIKFSEVFQQTFMLSIGMTNELDNAEEPKLTKLGTGFKFSIIRPKFDKQTHDDLDAIYKYQDKLNEERKAKVDNDPNHKYLNSKLDKLKEELLKEGTPQKRKIEIMEEMESLNKLIEARETELAPDDSDETVVKISEKAKQFKINRASTFFLDLAGGVVTDFTEQTFNRSELTKGGLWLTGGFENYNSFSLLSVARYFYQPDKLLADDTGTISTDDLSSFDAGLRLIYKEPKKQKLSLSLEGIFRSVLNNDIVEPSWRTVVTTSYDVGNNQMLTFSFGKDFDNTYIKDNNLIAALNFIIGLGGDKNVLSKPTVPAE
jgi:hypothetical protein